MAAGGLLLEIGRLGDVEGEDWAWAAGDSVCESSMSVSVFGSSSSEVC